MAAKRQRYSEDDVYSGDEIGKQKRAASSALEKSAASAAAAVMPTSHELAKHVFDLDHAAHKEFVRQCAVSFLTMQDAVDGLHAYADQVGCKVRIRNSRVSKNNRPVKTMECRVPGCPFKVILRDIALTVTRVDLSKSRLRHVHLPVQSDTSSSDLPERTVERAEWTEFFEWSLRTRHPSPDNNDDDDDEWLRQEWVTENPLKPLNGMMGKLFVRDVHVMEGHYDWTRHRQVILRSAKLHRVSKARTHYNGKPTKSGGGRLLFHTSSMILEDFTAALQAGEREYFAWWYARTNRVADEDNLLALLRVDGMDALDLQKMLLFLHVNHEVLANDQFMQGDGHERHAVFPSSSSSSSSLCCYLAINKYALRAVRLAMLRYIPLECKFPCAPLLIQAWATKPCSRHEDSVRRQGIVAAIAFVAQHVHRGVCGSGGGGGDWRCTCIYGHNAPQFALYENLPMFVSYLRCRKDEILLERISESQPGGRLADAGDSLYKLLAAFVFQKKEHFILKSALNELWGRFVNGTDHEQVRAKYPIAYALLHYLKSTPGMGCVDQQWISLHVPTWNVLAAADLPVGCARPDPSFLAHHFVYELCFDTAFFSLELRTLLCNQIVINHPPMPAVNESPQRLADFWFRAELRNYEANLAKPLDSEAAALRTVSKPTTKDLWPLNTLFLLFSSMQHIAWNPKAPDLRGPVRLADPALFACRQLNLPVGYEARRGPDGGSIVYYMESFLLAWTDHSVSSPPPPHPRQGRSALYAYNLVRDEQFYADRSALAGGGGGGGGTMEESD